jgi:hypothetical protein
MSSIAVFLVVAGGSALAAGGLGKNTVGSTQLKKNAVTSAKVKNNAITGGKIKNGAVSGSKIGGGAVGASNLAANAVSADKIANGAVSADKIANGAVTEGKLAGGAVTESKLGNDAVTGAKVKDGSLTGSDIQQGTLNQVKAANIYATEYDVSAGKLVRPSDPGIKSQGCLFVCFVEYPVSIAECSATGTSTDATGNGTAEPTFVEIYHPSSNPKEIGVVQFNESGTITAHDFSVTIICPTTS